MIIISFKKVYDEYYFNYFLKLLWLLLCVGSGTCIERYQVDAIKQFLNRCIGCGACVPTCSEGAI